MLIPELIAEWPGLAVLFDGDETPWREEVAGWDRPWRIWLGSKMSEFMAAGIPAIEAEEAAYRAVLEMRANPRRTAGQMAGGGAVVKDAVARPRMVRRGRKAAPGQVEMFAEVTDDERSTTYGMESL